MCDTQYNTQLDGCSYLLFSFFFSLTLFFLLSFSLFLSANFAQAPACSTQENKTVRVTSNMVQPCMLVCSRTLMGLQPCTLINKHLVSIYADVLCNLILMDRCSQLFQQACDDFSDPFAKFYFEADDNDDGNPECMWNSRTSSYCNPYDACTNYPTESKCKTDDECSWKSVDGEGGANGR